MSLPEDNMYRNWYAFHMDELESLLEELKANPKVQSIILFGSQARGDARPESDIDLIIVCNETKRGVEEHNCQMFELVYVTEADAVQFYNAHKDNCVRTWESAKILFDRDGSAGRLQEVARRIKETGKEKPSRDALQHAKFDAVDFMRALTEKCATDETTALFLLYGKLPRLVETYYSVRGLWIPAPKRTLLNLKEIDAILYGLIADVYRPDIRAYEKIEITKKIIEHVFAGA